MKTILSSVHGSLLFFASALACSKPGVMQNGECLTIAWSDDRPLTGKSFSASYVESPQLLLTNDLSWLVGAPLLLWDTSGRVATVRSGDSLSVHFAAAPITTSEKDNILLLDEVVPLPGGVWRMANVRAAVQPDGAIAFAFVIPEAPGTTNTVSRREVLSS
jgi:hypothetical protein